MSGTNYYQRNREVILNRAKDSYEDNKELLRERERQREREQKINIGHYLKKKIYKENMEKTDIITCLKRKNKN